MANKYQTGKIYKITSPQTEQCYVGSTIERHLSSRLSQHECEYRRYQNKKQKSNTRSFDIIKFGDAVIELVENYPCETKSELLQREKHWIVQLNCVNKARPIINEEEKRQLTHERYVANKEAVLAKNTAYRAQNRAKIRAQHSQVYICSCGKEYTQANKNRHERTQYHLENKRDE